MDWPPVCLAQLSVCDVNELLSSFSLEVSHFRLACLAS